MNIFDIPREVISNNILPCLHLNDLLRLRRVNRFAKSISEDYITVFQMTTQRKIVIHPYSKEGPRSLATFLTHGLPVQAHQFYFPTSHTEVFSLDAMKEFAKKYGDQVHHLHLTHLEIPIVSADVMEFLESLPNLAHLVIGSMSLSEENIDKLINPGPPMENPTLEKIREDIEKAMARSPCPIPSTFKNLKSIRVREYEYDCPNPESAENIWYFIEGCYSKQLEHVEYPYDRFVIEGETIPWAGPLGTIMSMIKNRRKDFPTEPNLQVVDMLGLEYKERPNVDEPSFELNSSSFYELIRLCTENGNDVKLQNVDGNFIDAVMLLDNSVEGALGCVEKINKTVMSVRNVGEELVKLELHLLEQVEIPEDREEWGGLSLENCCMPSGEYQRPEWTNLKKLELHMSGRRLGKNLDGKRELSKEILDFFFVGIKREKMEQLKLGFKPNYRMRVTKDENIPFPKMKDVMDSCPNLTILRIAYWPGSNKAISMLWSGLPLLEEVTLDACKNLGNVAFVGTDKDRPTFLKLKKLKRVRLSNLEMMPKVTDTLLNLVFRRMRLRQLNLTSNSPINSITPEGIKALLTGEFAESIESFPLGQLKMKNVTKEDAKSLESLFRSSQMH